MVGSIDPRCETIRGTHWPKTGRVVVWNSRRGSHLGQRSKPTASTGRTYGCKRSDQTSKTSCATGAVHIWVPDRARCARLSGTTGIDSIFKQQMHVRIPAARFRPSFVRTLSPEYIEGAGKAGCLLHPQPCVQNKNKH